MICHLNGKNKQGHSIIGQKKITDIPTAVNLFQRIFKILNNNYSNNNNIELYPQDGD